MISYTGNRTVSALAVRRIAATGRRVQAAGGATRTRVRDRSRSAGARAHAIGASGGFAAPTAARRRSAAWRASPGARNR
jgi:hypothetical protein